MRLTLPLNDQLSCHAEFISASKTKQIIDSENPVPFAELDSVSFQDRNDMVVEYYIVFKSILVRLELQHTI